MYVLTTQIYYKKQIPKVPYYPEQNILPSCPSPKFMDSHDMVKFHINSHSYNTDIGCQKDEPLLKVFWEVWKVFAIK